MKDVRVGHEMFPWIMVLILILVTPRISWRTGSTASSAVPGRRLSRGWDPMSISFNPIGPWTLRRGSRRS